MASSRTKFTFTFYLLFLSFRHYFGAWVHMDWKNTNRRNNLSFRSNLFSAFHSYFDYVNLVSRLAYLPKQSVCITLAGRQTSGSNCRWPRQASRYRVLLPLCCQLASRGSQVFRLVPSNTHFAVLSCAYGPGLTSCTYYAFDVASSIREKWCVSYYSWHCLQCMNKRRTAKLI